MTNVNVQPDFVATAAADVSQIRSALGAANSAAAAQTSGLVAAAGDEVSTAIAGLFSGYGQEFQAALAKTGVFHDAFAALLANAGNTYAQAEAAISNTLGLTGSAAASPAATTVSEILIMTGSGTAVPPLTYINNVFTRYLESAFTNLGSLIPVTTAEGLYPFTGTKDLTLDVSLSRGVLSLDNAINAAIMPGSGHAIAVLGYSQSAIIASMEMPKLLAEGFTSSQINFTLLGDPSNPNGGLFARFPGLSLPSLGVTFGTSTPANDFPTTIYTLEYDGFADFPQYPIDVFSDLNALAGIVFVHGTYPTLSAATLATAFPLTNTVGATQTTYYMIPTHDLPLLTPLRAIPFIGNPLADLIQPDLTAIVNWGYGDPNYGYSTSAPNVQTPFGFLPPLSATEALGPLLASGTQQGINAFTADLSHISLPSAASVAQAIQHASTGAGTLALSAPTSPQAAINGFLSEVQTLNTNLVGTFTTDLSTAYATLLPTADIATALVVSLPSYDLNLFIDGLQQAVNGDPMGLVNAIGYPISADIGLATLAGGFELISIENSLDTILTGSPNPGLQ